MDQDVALLRKRNSELEDALRDLLPQGPIFIIDGRDEKIVIRVQREALKRALRLVRKER